MLKHSVLKVSAFLTLLLSVAMMFVSCDNIEFKVDFYVDNAIYATINTNGEEVLKMPTDPERENDSFVGWFWDKDSWEKPFTMNSLLNVPLSSNLSVFAKWKSDEHVHVFDEKSISEKYFASKQTCTKSAAYYYSCSCGEKGRETFEYGDPLGHDFSEDYITDVEPTCTTDGFKSKHCLNDGCSERTEKTVVPRPGHDWTENSVKTAPDFNAGGVLVRYCKRDSAHFKETFIPALNENDYRTVISVEPTCSNEGKTDYYIEVDGKTFKFSVELPKTHAPTTRKGYAPTCDKSGKTDEVYCSICGFVITPGATISSLGHDYRGLRCLVCKKVDESYSKIDSLVKLRNIESNLSGKYYLGTDLRLSNDWTPLCKEGSKKFVGVFDGDGHTIENINAKNATYGGLFYENGGEIRNLTISAISYTADYFDNTSNYFPSYGETSGNFGGIAVYNGGTISGCKIVGRVNFSTSNHIGIYFTFISSAQRNLYYKNDYCFGGIVAVNNGNVSDCKVEADITYKVSNYLGMGFGALGGFNTSHVTYLTSNSSVGGIAGRNNSKITSCVVSGSFSAGSEQNAEAWKFGSTRRYVNLTAYVKVGSLIGSNNGAAQNCKGTGVNPNRADSRGGDTSYVTLIDSVYSDVTGGIIGKNEANGSSVTSGLIG